MRLGTPHGRPAQDPTLGRRSLRPIASGLDRYRVEYAAVPHPVEGAAGRDRGRRLGRSVPTRSQRGHGDLGSVPVTGRENDGEEQSLHAHWMPPGLLV